MKRTIVNPIFRDIATYLQTAAESNWQITEFEITFNVQIRPGHEGFENSLRIIYGLAED